MTIVGFNHVELVVGDLDAALEHFGRIVAIRPEAMIYHRDFEDRDPATGEVVLMHFALIPIGEVYLELVEPVSGGPMKRFLERTGGGVHHIGLASDDVRAEWAKHDQRRERLGVLDARPRVNADGVSAWFLHPKANWRTLFEVSAAWAKTSVADMTPVEPTPDWERELGGP